MQFIIKQEGYVYANHLPHAVALKTFFISFLFCSARLYV